MESVAELLSLAPDWDSYGATQVSFLAAKSALELILRLSDIDVVDPPALVPTSSGGMQLEWHRPRRIVELEISPVGRAVLYVADADRDEEFEVALTRAVDAVRRALARD